MGNGTHGYGPLGIPLDSQEFGSYSFAVPLSFLLVAFSAGFLHERVQGARRAGSGATPRLGAHKLVAFPRVLRFSEALTDRAIQTIPVNGVLWMAAFFYGTSLDAVRVPCGIVLLLIFAVDVAISATAIALMVFMAWVSRCWRPGGDEEMGLVAVTADVPPE